MRSATVADFLDAAKLAFTNQVSAITMEEIARDAGVGIGTLYRHFPNRDALVEEVYRDEAEQLAEAARRLAAEAEPLEALRDGCGCSSTTWRPSGTWPSCCVSSLTALLSSMPARPRWCGILADAAGRPRGDERFCPRRGRAARSASGTGRGGQYHQRRQLGGQCEKLGGHPGRRHPDGAHGGLISEFGRVQRSFSPSQYFRTPAISNMVSFVRSASTPSLFEFGVDADLIRITLADHQIAARAGTAVQKGMADLPARGEADIVTGPHLVALLAEE